MAVATCGWLMAKQLRAAEGEGGNTPFLRAKIAACRYYLDVMVPEALSLKGSAMAGANLLYALDPDGLAA
jgi:3-(methylthio)propanoyl-CoA dehydrogenase